MMFQYSPFLLSRRLLFDVRSPSSAAAQGLARDASASHLGIDAPTQIRKDALGFRARLFERQHVDGRDRHAPRSAVDRILHDEGLGLAHAGAQHAEAFQVLCPVEGLFAARMRAGSFSMARSVILIVGMETLSPKAIWRRKGAPNNEKLGPAALDGTPRLRQRN
jgi:hypothetical protein